MAGWVGVAGAEQVARGVEGGLAAFARGSCAAAARPARDAAVEGTLRHD